jgi:hypothetical protein
MFEGPGGQVGSFQSNQSIGSDTFLAPEIDAIDWVTGSGTASFGGIISIEGTPETPSPVPERATWLLLNLGLAGVPTLSLKCSLPRRA